MLKKKLIFYSQFFPIRLNFLILVITVIIIYFTFFKQYLENEESFGRIIFILSGLIIVFTILVIGLSFVSNFTSFFSFIFKKRIIEKSEEAKKDIIKIYFEKNSFEAGYIPVRIEILGIHSPALGFAKVRILFDDYHLSEEIILNESIKDARRKKHIGIRGRALIKLTEKKDYPIISSIISFEDMFHMFLFTYRESECMGIYITPNRQELDIYPVTPDKSEELTTRILVRKIVEGELLNYKKFEDQDDIRRIVWKIYAKNRELVIRTPDKTNPYASHINFFISFYEGMFSGRFNNIKNLFLNEYKDKIRKLLDSIQNQGFTVNTFLDQNYSSNYNPNIDDYNLYKISTALFQNSVDLNTIIMNNAKKKDSPKILCISSLYPNHLLEDIDRLVMDNSLTFFIPLSNVFNKKNKFKLINLLIKPIKNEYSELGKSYKYYTLKRKMIKNEEKIRNFFKTNKFMMIEI